MASEHPGGDEVGPSPRAAGGGGDELRGPGRSLGDGGGAQPPRPAGQGSTPSPESAGCVTPAQIRAPEARTGPRCTCTHTQRHTNLRSHTPPSAQRLLPAASPQLEPDSRDAGHSVATGAEVGPARATAWDSAGRRCPGSPQAGGWNLDPGASVCPAPPRSLLPLEARGVVSRGGAGKGGCCACEVERQCLPEASR